jgi:DNA-binding MarR family transcriptional regulator
MEETARVVGGFRTAADIVDEAVAATFGVNRTDLRLIEALQIAGSLNAGELARTVGLSPAATTTAIDRLVAAGHAVRRRDERDGRVVVVALTPEARKIGDHAFGAMVEAGRGVLRRYTRDELLVIRDFMRRARQVEVDQAEKLRSTKPR